MPWSTSGACVAFVMFAGFVMLIIYVIFPSYVMFVEIVVYVMLGGYVVLTDCVSFVVVVVVVVAGVCRTATINHHTRAKRTHVIKKLMVNSKMKYLKILKKKMKFIS